MFGPFISRNLTPNAAGRPAGLTLAQFLETMHTGVDLKNRHPEISPLLQVMPWPAYANMSDGDLRAIYEYLRAIPSIPTQNCCSRSIRPPVISKTEPSTPRRPPRPA